MSASHLSYLQLFNLDSESDQGSDPYLFELPLDSDPTLADDAELSINAYYRAIWRN